jgi:hypothetical protein
MHVYIYKWRSLSWRSERASALQRQTFCFRIRARWARHARRSCGGRGTSLAIFASSAQGAGTRRSCGGGSTSLAIFASSTHGAGTRRGSCDMHKYISKLTYMYIHSYIVYIYTPQNSIHFFVCKDTTTHSHTHTHTHRSSYQLVLMTRQRRG